MNLNKLLKPTSVAVIGASEKEGFGGDVCRNILSYVEDRSHVYFIHPKRDSVFGVPCYKSISDVPENVDLMVICTSQKTVIPLLQEGANKCDVIFGPLYSKQVSALAGFCKTYGIKMVIPFSITGDDVERNKEIFQVYQSPEQLNEATIQAFLKRFPSAHPIFVDCNDSTSRKGNFTFGLRKELERRKINYSITNVNSSIDQFAKAFAPSVRNVVVLNTGRSPQLTAVLNKLDELDAKYPGAVVSLFGYTEWLMYAKYNLDRFYKYDTYIPSTFY